MFNFPRWRAFLEARSADLTKEGMQVRVAGGSQRRPKSGMILETVLNGMYGGFENWSTGETDYTIMPVPSRTKQPLVHKWGLILSDETFEATFDEFMGEFRRLAIPHNANPK